MLYWMSLAVMNGAWNHVIVSGLLLFSLVVVGHALFKEAER